MIIRSIVVGPFQTNNYIVGCSSTRQAVIIDGGGDADRLMQLVAEENLALQAIWQTHAHIDHVAALPELRERTDAPIYMHRDDEPLYEAVPRQAIVFGMRVGSMPEINGWIEEGQRLHVGELEAQVLLLPGHSPGSVAFYFPDHEVLISGDVLFAGSIGRTDLPGGNVPQMKTSLARLAGLPDQTRVFSGHGPQTTIGHERRHNPFLGKDW